MTRRNELGQGPRDIWLEVTAAALAVIVLLACKVAESIELFEDGSGTARVEVEFSAAEVSMMGDPKAQLKEVLEKNPKLTLVGEGERNGGRYYVLEQRFEAVSELNDNAATYAWVRPEGSAADHKQDAAPPFSSLFRKRHKLLMHLQPPQEQAGASFDRYSLTVRVPGEVSSTNGRKIRSDQVEWDRLARDGSGDLWLETSTWHLPKPGEVVNWYTAKQRQRYFDDNALAWVDGGTLWVGNPFGEAKRAVAEVGAITSLQAGGSRLLWYRSPEGRDRLAPAEVTILNLERSSKPTVLSSVSGAALAPDGTKVAFGRFKDATSEWSRRRGSGLSLLDLESGTEVVIGQELELPQRGLTRTYGEPFSAFDSESWLHDTGYWSVDGTNLYVTRHVLARKEAKGYGSHGWTGSTFTFVTDQSEIDWQLVVCDDEATGFEVFAAIGEKVVLGPGAGICDTGSGKNLLRTMPGWSKLLAEYSFLLSAAYSPTGRLAVVALKSSVDREGRPRVSCDLIVGESVGPRVAATLFDLSGLEELESTVFVPGVQRLSWHPTRPVLAFDNFVIDVEGTGVVNAISSTAKHAAWVVAPRTTIPSLKTVELLLYCAYWTAVALLTAVPALVVHSLLRAVRRRTSRRSTLPLPRSCVQCGMDLDAGAIFCRHCGARVPGNESSS